MAVPTGSGTETIHSHWFEDVDAIQTLIYGVQHHVYTVLSIIAYCNVLNATTDFGYLAMKGYDNHGGSPGQMHRFARFNIQAGETYDSLSLFPSGVHRVSSSPVFFAIHLARTKNQSEILFR